MTKLQKALSELKARQSRERGRMAEIALMEGELTPEVRSELEEIQTGTPDLERKIQAAMQAVDNEAEAQILETRETRDPESREIAELRARCQVSRFLQAAVKGKRLEGPEAELIEERGLEDGQIPMELWEPSGTEDRAVTGAPSTTGQTLAPLHPAVFAPSLAGYLGVQMPMVGTGAYATGRIKTNATGGAVAKGSDVLETAAAWESFTTTPHRVGAALNLSVEDIATVGTESFEPILREHISLVVSDSLNDLLVNGDGSGANPTGFIKRLETINNPTDPTATETFDSFLASYLDQVEGTWATELAHVRMLVGVTAYKLMGKSFRDAGNNHKGSGSFINYCQSFIRGGLKTSSHMPAASSTIERAIAIRTSRNTQPAPMRLAECPHWGNISIDDPYTGAGKGERRLVVSALVGDLIITQPGAYNLVEYKTS